MDDVQPGEMNIHELLYNVQYMTHCQGYSIVKTPGWLRGLFAQGGLYPDERYGASEVSSHSLCLPWEVFLPKQVQAPWQTQVCVHKSYSGWLSDLKPYRSGAKY
jgi:hypothetical protein